MFDESKIVDKFKSLSDDELEVINKNIRLKTQEEFERFKNAYEKDECYLCNKPFSTFSTESPCVHGLLRRGKFKPKHIDLVSKRFGYSNIAAFLRWCANMEKPLVNINDISHEMGKGKVISNTIRWKNIEWTFDCSESDFRGHPNSASDYPHYHFQMRIDGRQFINFNSYHLPFNENDMFALTMSRNHPDKFLHNFGDQGEGMGIALDIVGDDPLTAFEHMKIAEEGEAIYHISTMLVAPEGGGISGDLIAECIKISRETGEPVSSLLHKKMAPNVVVKSIISASENTPDITPRTEHKRFGE